MKKTIILSAVVALMAATANAGSLASVKESVEGLLDGSSDIATASLNMAGTTLSISKDASVYSVETLGQVTGALIDGSVFVINNPSDASAKAIDASQAAATWAVTTSGQLIQLASDGVVFLIEDPSGASVAAATSTSNAVKATVDASGRVLLASGGFLKDKYGDDVQLLFNGSGQIYTVSEGAVVASVTTAIDVSGQALSAALDSAQAVVTFVGDTSVDAIQVSGASLADLAVASFQGSKDVFDASTRSGRQYNSKK